jgi:hypothetical protein
MIWRAGNITRCSAIVTRRIYQRRLCTRLLTSVRSLGVIVTWGTICLLAIPAQAQEIPSGDFSAVAIVANRWLLKQIRPRDAISRSAVDGEIFFEIPSIHLALQIGSLGIDRGRLPSRCKRGWAIGLSLIASQLWSMASTDHPVFTTSAG